MQERFCFHVCLCTMCMPRAHQVKNHWIPWSQSYVWLLAAIWVQLHEEVFLTTKQLLQPHTM